MDQRIVSTIQIAGLVKKILVLSIHIAATATNDIDLAICIAPSRVCILKHSICIAGRRRNILNEKYRITYRIVQGVEHSSSKEYTLSVAFVLSCRKRNVDSFSVTWTLSGQLELGIG